MEESNETPVEIQPLNMAELTEEETKLLASAKVKLENPLEKALVASETAKNNLPEKLWGGQYYDNDAKRYVDNPERINASHPRYWAKRNCKDCYGRGFIGKKIITVAPGQSFQIDAMCTCAQNRFKKWRTAWIKDFLEKYPTGDVPVIREESQAENIDETVNNV